MPISKYSEMSTANHIIDAFGEVAASHGWGRREPEGLIVPYFPTEFNRCIDHRELNRLVNTPDEASSGWHQVSPACRTNDMRKVESGWHATVFEVLASVGSYPFSQKALALHRLVDDSINLLTEKLGLDIRRLRVTYFGGGEVTTCESLDPALEWKNLWLDAGVQDRNLVPVRGPKNYVLFVGSGERCGPKCEVLYRVENKTGERWLEIGTLIFDDSRFLLGSNGRWEVSPALSLVAGAAYGLDRLIAACIGAADFTELPSWNLLIRHINKKVRQPEEALSLLRGDILVLADQVRACAFLIAAGAAPDETPQGRLLAIMLRRVRRKVATLCIDHWEELVVELETELLALYGSRYPWLGRAQGRLREWLAAVNWPEGWNPESYATG